MDWITFIKWNGVAYTSYYGVNLLVDFMLARRKQSPKGSFVTYQLKDLGVEEPQVIKSADFLFVDKEKDKSDQKVKPKKAKKQSIENVIGFNAPIERQGIPVDEYMRTAVQTGNRIFDQK